MIVMIMFMRKQRHKVLCGDYILKSSKMMDLRIGTRWSTGEDSLLRNLVEQLGCIEAEIDWNYVATFFKKRSPIHCKNRWDNAIKTGFVTRGWTEEEDRIIIDLIQKVV